MANASLTWLGHASFRLESAGGKTIYVDPWLDENPKCPESEKDPQCCDLVCVTHAHGDHVANAPSLAKKFGCPVIAPFELANWLGTQGVETAMPLQKGGTHELEGVKVSATNAFHSSSTPDGQYGGEPMGYVIEPDGGPSIYFAGDTCVFGDMQLIARLYAPQVGVLPIGNLFTMDPRGAALACELLGIQRVVPCHWGTFPALTGTPDELRRHAKGVEVVDIQPGQTVEL